MHNCTMQQTVDCIAAAIAAKQFTQHVVVNVAKLVHMQSDDSLAQSVRACDLVNIDGMGVVWGARFCGHQVPERVAGVDFSNYWRWQVASNTQFFCSARPMKLLLKRPRWSAKLIPN